MLRYRNRKLNEWYAAGSRKLRLLEMADNASPLIEVTTKGDFTAYIYMHRAFLKDHFDIAYSDCKFIKNNILALPKLIEKRLDQDNDFLEEIDSLLKERDKYLSGLPESKHGMILSPFHVGCWDKTLPNGEWRYLIEISIEPEYKPIVNWTRVSSEARTMIAEMLASKLKDILVKDAPLIGFHLFFDLSDPRIRVSNDFLPNPWEILR